MSAAAAMPTAKLTLEVPDELVRLVGSEAAVVMRARELLVLDLLRSADLSQGQAARLLGITRWDLLALMGEHQVPSGPQTAEEIIREVDDLRRMLPDRQLNGRRQQ